MYLNCPNCGEHIDTSMFSKDTGKLKVAVASEHDIPIMYAIKNGIDPLVHLKEIGYSKEDLARVRRSWNRILGRLKVFHPKLFKMDVRITSEAFKGMGNAARQCIEDLQRDDVDYKEKKEILDCMTKLLEVLELCEGINDGRNN